MNPPIEIIREHLTPAQVLDIRQQARKEGATVNINRLHSQLVEIQIIYPSKVIEVTPRRLKAD